ncbi:ras family domain-containing protein [Ditylenchus destructor]|uniref:Ras family domain-containing protein n=1 Tax=Ditylenchus destructor TaxID=166010 RepID=A0AAD4NHI0_9BILA|nr:ras family domain-containing protein [Ditylenchus destructor]
MNNQTTQLFELCDSDRKGYLTKEDLKTACPQLTSDEIVFIFSCLDTNNSGTIEKVEFCAGFEETLKQGESSGFGGIQNRLNSAETYPDENTYGFEYGRKKTIDEDTHKEHHDGVVEISGNGFFNNDTADFHHTHRARSQPPKFNRMNSRRKLSHPHLAVDIPCKDEVLQLYEELQSSGVPQIMSKFEEVVGTLCREIDQRKEENEMLQNMHKAERENYNKRMNEIEYEIDQQLAMAERKAREEERERLNKEKQELKEKLENEMKELQGNIEHLQKMEKMLKKESKGEQSEELKEKLDAIARENRTLKNSLADNHLEMTLIKAELSELKCEYEVKTMEMMNEKHETLASVGETENVKRQLQLLYDANKRLHETNDNLRGALDTRTNIIRLVQQNSFSSPSYSSPHLPLPRSNSFLHTSYNNAEGQPPIHVACTSDTANPPLDDDDRDSGFPTDMSLHSRMRGGGSSRTSVSDVDLFRCASVDTSKDSIVNSNYTSSLVEFNGPPDRTFRVVMCGDASVGVDFHVKSIKMGKTNVAVQLWDTAGQERFRSLCNSYFRRADGAILVYDCSCERSFLRIRDWIETVRHASNQQESTCKPIPVLIVANKIDLRPSDAEPGSAPGESLAQILDDKPSGPATHSNANSTFYMSSRNFVTQKEGEHLSKVLETDFIECSALDGTNIDAALLLLVGEMMKQEDMQIKNTAVNLAKKPKKSSCFSCRGN